MKFRRTKAASLASAIALVAAALAFGGTSLVLGPKQAPTFDLTSATGFTITSTISSSSTSQVAAALYPGAQRYLWYTVQNPLAVSITVNTLSITAVTPPKPPASCAATNLDLSHTTYSGALVVPAKVGAVNGTNKVAVPISLKDAGDLDGCKNASFGFSYTGTATYTEVYATSTLVASSLQPSIVGQAVTYTATVTAMVGSAQDPLPNSPTGAVTFKDGTATICASVPLASATASTSTAQCSPSAYLAATTHPIAAVYTNADGNFSGSTSTVMSEIVNPSSTTTVLGSAPNPSTFGHGVTLSATTLAASGPTPVGSASFYLGSPSGAHALLGTAALVAGKATLVMASLPGGSDALYAAYSGNVNDSPSTSGVVVQAVTFTSACITANGGYTVKSGQAICITGRVNGGVIVQAGGAVSLNGATVNGGITSTGATALAICGSTINGNVVVSGSTGFVLFGDGGDDGSPGCAGNTINASTLTLSNNTAGMEFAANHETGSVTISGNAGTGATSEDTAPEVEGNTITGALACVSNSSLIDGGQKNAVTGIRSGQCSGTGF